MAEAIWAEDPDRLIIADGLWWGAFPCKELFAMPIAQAARGYQPMGLTHYKAGWVEGADRYPVPEWPVRCIGGGFLYGSMKKELKSALKIHTNFKEPVLLVVTVGEVSHHARLVARIDGEEKHALSFTPGPGEGPWQESTFYEEYNSYKARYDQDITVPIPAGKHEAALDVDDGDWLSLTRVALRDETGEYDSISIIPKWGEPNATISTNPESRRFQTAQEQNAAWLWEKHFKRWADLREQGIGVMVGEWGAFNETNHDVVLRWMEDSLKTFRRAGIGWALWNFRGAFGILDSGRKDVEYESFHGHQLDREMLEMLRRY
ncbi:MAG TPA: hypothetical protein ENN29_07260 [Candidatus Hydrogenedentes bacterium]|nr:hypothetical protein [Candidatus Hydrogenedentota bacterium]